MNCEVIEILSDYADSFGPVARDIFDGGDFPDIALEALHGFIFDLAVRLVTFTPIRRILRGNEKR